METNSNIVRKPKIKLSDIQDVIFWCIRSGIDINDVDIIAGVNGNFSEYLYLDTSQLKDSLLELSYWGVLYEIKEHSRKRTFGIYIYNLDYNLPNIECSNYLVVII